MSGERKPFHAEVRRLIEEQVAARGSAPPALTDEDRVRMGRAVMVQMLESRDSIEGLPNGVEAQEIEIAPGISGRLYLPPGTKAPLPTLVYVHGGGWVLASVAIFDPFCRLLSDAAGVAIVSVEYRLAPEHPYPAGLEDVLTAVQWTRSHAGDWGGEAQRIGLGGDSAGANLAAVAANRLCAEGNTLRTLMLLYPITDHPDAGYPSFTENAVGYGLEANLVRWFWQLYAPGVSWVDPDLAPMHVQELPALPATLVATAEYDVLRDEGIAYAEKLKQAGVAVTHLHAEDMGHNFPATPNLVGRFPECIETLHEIAAWLRNTL